MLWFKHRTDTDDNEKLVQVLHLFGYAGYGRWWRLVELVAAKVTKKSLVAELTLPPKKWAKNLGYQVKHCENFLRCLANVKATSSQRPLIVFKQESNVWTVSIPNILEYRDEYTRKSGHTPEPIPTTSGHSPENVAPEVEEETEVKNKSKDQGSAPGSDGKKEGGKEGQKPRRSMATKDDPYIAFIQTTDKNRPLRILSSQAQTWQEILPRINVIAELEGISTWFSDEGRGQQIRWTPKEVFAATFGALKKKDREAIPPEGFNGSATDANDFVPTVNPMLQETQNLFNSLDADKARILKERGGKPLVET